MLLESVIFHYHGLDEDEEKILSRTSKELDAEGELIWANDFIASDYMTAFERARDYLKKTFSVIDESQRLLYIDLTWKANNEKGYITEMEATAMLKLAKDWGVDRKLIEVVRAEMEQAT